MNIIYKVVDAFQYQQVIELGKKVERDLLQKNWQNFFSAPTKQEISWAKDGKATIIGAVDDDKLVGSALYRDTTADTFILPKIEGYQTQKRKSISKLSVLPEKQEKGIGKKLLSFIYNNLIDYDKEEVMRDCSVQNMGTITNIFKAEKEYYLKSIDDWGNEEGLFFTFFLKPKNCVFEKKETLKKLQLNASLINQPFDYSLQKQMLNSTKINLQGNSILGKIIKISKNSLELEIAKYRMQLR